VIICLSNSINNNPSGLESSFSAIYILNKDFFGDLFSLTSSFITRLTPLDVCRVSLDVIRQNNWQMHIYLLLWFAETTRVHGRWLTSFIVRKLNKLRGNWVENIAKRIRINTKLRLSRYGIPPLVSITCSLNKHVLYFWNLWINGYAWETTTLCVRNRNPLRYDR